MQGAIISPLREPSWITYKITISICVRVGFGFARRTRITPNGGHTGKQLTNMKSKPEKDKSTHFVRTYKWSLNCVKLCIQWKRTQAAAAAAMTINRKITRKCARRRARRRRRREKRPQLKQIYYFLMCSLCCCSLRLIYRDRRSALPLWCALVLIICNDNNALLTYRTALNSAQCILLTSQLNRTWASVQLAGTRRGSHWIEYENESVSRLRSVADLPISTEHSIPCHSFAR